MDTRHFKGNSFLRSAQWEAERDKKQALDWYLLSAKCFLNTVQYTRKDMVHAPWGYHLNRTDEVRHNWPNSYPVLMTSLWEPKSPSVKTGAIHQTLTSVLCLLRGWHSQPHWEGELYVWHNCLLFSLPPQTVFNGFGSSGESGFVDNLGESGRPLSQKKKLSPILLELLSWLPFLTYHFNSYSSPVDPYFFYIHWRSLDTASDLMLCSWWPNYALWPVL